MKRQQAHHITVSFKNENLCRIFERERNRIKTSFVTSRFIACRYLFVWPISLANGTGISFDTFHLFQSFGFFLAQLNYYYVAHTFWHNACLVGRSVGHNFLLFFFSARVIGVTNQSTRILAKIVKKRPRILVLVTVPQQLVLAVRRTLR